MAVSKILPICAEKIKTRLFQIIHLVILVHSKIFQSLLRFAELRFRQIKRKYIHYTTLHYNTIQYNYNTIQCNTIQTASDKLKLLDDAQNGSISSKIQTVIF